MEYVKGADGEMYREQANPDGSSEFVKVSASEGVRFVEVGASGRYIAESMSPEPRLDASDEEQDHLIFTHRLPGGVEETVRVPVRDPEVYEQQHAADSHQRFFQERREAGNVRRDDGVVARQRLRRQASVQRQLDLMVQSQVDPGGLTGVEVIKDTRFFELQALYDSAVREGRSQQCEYQPLVTYRSKVARARPILKGEVGILVNGGVQGLRDGAKVTILRLEGGYGEGTLVQVPREEVGDDGN